MNPLATERTDPVHVEERAARAALAGRFVDLVAGKLLATEEIFRHHLSSDVPFTPVPAQPAVPGA